MFDCLQWSKRLFAKKNKKHRKFSWGYPGKNIEKCRRFAGENIGIKGNIFDRYDLSKIPKSALEYTHYQHDYVR